MKKQVINWILTALILIFWLMRIWRGAVTASVLAYFGGFALAGTLLCLIGNLWASAAAAAAVAVGVSIYMPDFALCACPALLLLWMQLRAASPASAKKNDWVLLFCAGAAVIWAAVAFGFGMAAIRRNRGGSPDFSAWLPVAVLLALLFLCGIAAGYGTSRPRGRKKRRGAAVGDPAGKKQMLCYAVGLLGYIGAGVCSVGRLAPLEIDALVLIFPWVFYFVLLVLFGKNPAFQYAAARTKTLAERFLTD